MIVVFAGPTITHDEITSQIECECLPPVSHGDLLKLDLGRITAIGIVDGYFEGAPSVWHKEILYAMDQGVHVYGASSMGALRAAELHTFGMQGVGQIFEWYRDLVIEDDDEVAVLHGPVEAGYAVASEPMVSVRRTLQNAVSGKIIDQGEHDRLIDQAKATFYKKRSWGSLLADDQWNTLFSWVKENKVDLKKNDAVAMLQKMQADQYCFDKPFATDYSFEWTNVWDAAYRSIRGESFAPQLSESDSLVLDQLKLQPDLYKACEERALSSWVNRNPKEVEPGSGTREALRNFREKNGLMTRAALIGHMERVGLSEADLETQMEQEGTLLQAKNLAGDLSEEIVGALRLDGQFSGLLSEGQKKMDALRLAGVSVESARVKRGSYLVWYFERVLRVGVPYDLERYAVENGFRDGVEFDRVVIGEYLYQRCLAI